MAEEYKVKVIDALTGEELPRRPWMDEVIRGWERRNELAKREGDLNMRLMQRALLLGVGRSAP